MNKLEKIYIKTIGCQMNEYDSSMILSLLNKAYGTIEVTNPKEADLLLLNTCSVREKAQEKVFSDLGRWRLIKKQRPEILIGVGGCLATQEGENILKRAPYVDIIFGPQTLHTIPLMINAVLQEKQPQVNLAWTSIDKFDNLPEPSVSGPCAYISIMEGCNKYCSFCIVPYTRGYEISRNFNDVIKEISTLAALGVKEITLLGQNVNAYKSQTNNGFAVDLADLLHYIAIIPEIERLRFTTSHPKEFNDNLIGAFKTIPKLANHIHLPVQSGSDTILNKMKRGYSSLEYQEKIHKLKLVRKNISISSDFIVGFPGETDKDFQSTLDLINTIGFDHSFSFIYSKRPGTPAANYPDDVSMEVKRQRLHTIQSLLLKHSTAISRTMINTTQKVVVANVSNKDNKVLCARTENNRLVTFLGNNSLVGKFIDLKIVASLPNSLQGAII